MQEHMGVLCARAIRAENLKEFIKEFPQMKEEEYEYEYVGKDRRYRAGRRRSDKAAKQAALADSGKSHSDRIIACSPTAL